MKKFAGILLALVMLLSLVPVTAMAAERADYGLYLYVEDGVGKAKKNGSGGDAIALPSGLSYADGEWTMTDFTFATTAATAIEFKDTTTLNLAGTNTVTGGNSEGNTYGIFARSYLTIQGSGNLTVTAGNATGTSGNSYGISSSQQSLTISNTAVTATAGTAGNFSSGLYGYYAVMIVNSDVIASGGAASISRGIYGSYQVSIEKSRVEATSGTATDSCGIYGSSQYKATVDVTGSTSSLSVTVPTGGTLISNPVVTTDTNHGVTGGTFTPDQEKNDGTGSVTPTEGATKLTISPMSTITADDSIRHGTVYFTVDDEKVTAAAEGDTVTVMATPDKGYKLTGLFVCKSDAPTTFVAVNVDNTFTMPGYDVTVMAVFSVKSTGGSDSASSAADAAVKSAQTGDAGVILYAGMSFAALLGTGVALGKSREL